MTRVSGLFTVNREMKRREALCPLLFEAHDQPVHLAVISRLRSLLHLQYNLVCLTEQICWT